MLYAIVAVIILIIDQLVKYETTVNIALHTTKPLIPGFVELTNIHNNGAAFGIFREGRWIFVALTLIFAVIVVVLFAKKAIHGGLGRWSLTMVVAGGLGNCIDRIFNGYVVDMFNFQFMGFAVFNVADIFVTIGGVLFCLYIIFHKAPEKPAPPPSRRGSPKAPAQRQQPGKTNRAQPSAPTAPRRRTPEAPRPDYVSQLKKPVAEGRAALKAEAEPKISSFKSDGFVEWNTPEFDDAPTQKPAVSPAPVADPFEEFFKKAAPLVQPEKRPSSFEEIKRTPAPAPKPSPSPNSPEKPAANTAPPQKKSDGDFSLEDILAEFSNK
ncbi:MAG: signal peptidase II [Oscillospiraceae bacterium]